MNIFPHVRLCHTAAGEDGAATPKMTAAGPATAETKPRSKHFREPRDDRAARFAHAFVLAPQTDGYYVKNEILRFCADDFEPIEAGRKAEHDGEAARATAAAPHAGSQPFFDSEYYRLYASDDKKKSTGSPKKPAQQKTDSDAVASNGAAAPAVATTTATEPTINGIAENTATDSVKPATATAATTNGTANPVKGEKKAARPNKRDSEKKASSGQERKTNKDTNTEGKANKEKSSEEIKATSQETKASTTPKSSDSVPTPKTLSNEPNASENASEADNQENDTLVHLSGIPDYVQIPKLKEALSAAFGAVAYVRLLRQVGPGKVKENGEFCVNRRDRTNPFF